MGIDIYATWDHMTASEVSTQGHAYLAADKGRTGYLREDYHGSPYATKVLVPEAFETGDAYISSAKLEKRLSEVLIIAEMRERVVYGERDESAIHCILQSYRDFVSLCAQKEAKTGTPCRIFASA